MQSTSVNIPREMLENKFLLILVEESEYIPRLEEIIKSVGKAKTKICYVCLSKPYNDVIENLKGGGVNLDDFFFIDVLTSHYKKPEPVENCIFIQGPTDLAAIKDAIRDVAKKEHNVILFDTISTLLIYQRISSIVKFTHDLLTDGNNNMKKLFIALKGNMTPLEENQRLINDLEMFADKTLDLINK